MTSLRFVFLALPLVLAACSAPDDSSKACVDPATVDAAAPITRVAVRFNAGQRALALDSEALLSTGATLRPTKARVFLSQPALLTTTGERVNATLVDDTGEALPYGVALIDLERPEAMHLQLSAPAGDYQGIAFGVGVPERCPTGRMLNHSDASAMPAPLDVDSDMYWSWNPGYVFLKFEGQVRDGDAWSGFFFHVGEDRRFSTVAAEHPFTITAAGGEGPDLVVDFERLLTTASGTPSPNVADAEERRVHGGEHADELVQNIRESGFLRLDAHTH